MACRAGIGSHDRSRLGALGIPVDPIQEIAREIDRLGETGFEQPMPGVEQMEFRIGQVAQIRAR